MPTVVARPKAHSVSLLGDDAQGIRKWQDYAARNPDATIYHDIAWRDIFGRALGYRSYYLVAEAGDGAVTGILPLFRVPSLLGRPRLVSVPFRDRGGVVADDAQGFLALLQAAKQLRDDLSAVNVELKTITPYDAGLVEQGRLHRTDHWVHSEVEIGGLAADELRRMVGEKTRNMIRQAENAGLTVDVSGDEDALQAWMSTYRASQHHLGLPAFPRVFFDSMLRLLGVDGKARVVAVRDRQKSPMAACIVFVDKQRLIYGYSASTAVGRGARANDLMLFHLLEWACSNGMRWFDLGSDSPLQEGLLFFKRKWRAKQKPVPTYLLGEERAVENDSSSARFDLARRVVRRLPEQAAHVVTSPLIRFFG